MAATPAPEPQNPTKKLAHVKVLVGHLLSQNRVSKLSDPGPPSLKGAGGGGGVDDPGKVKIEFSVVPDPMLFTRSKNIVPSRSNRILKS